MGNHDTSRILCLLNICCLQCRSVAEHEFDSRLCSPLPDNCWMYHYDPDICSTTPGCKWTFCHRELPVGQELDPWEEEGAEHIETYDMVKEVCANWKAQFSIIEGAARTNQFKDASEFCESTGKTAALLQVKIYGLFLYSDPRQYLNLQSWQSFNTGHSWYVVENCRPVLWC